MGVHGIQGGAPKRWTAFKLAAQPCAISHHTLPPRSTATCHRRNVGLSSRLLINTCTTSTGFLLFTYFVFFFLSQTENNEIRYTYFVV